MNNHDCHAVISSTPIYKYRYPAATHAQSGVKQSVLSVCLSVCLFVVKKILKYVLCAQYTALKNREKRIYFPSWAPVRPHGSF